jgi:hypothetical protein
MLSRRAGETPGRRFDEWSGGAHSIGIEESGKEKYPTRG